MVLLQAARSEVGDSIEAVQEEAARILAERAQQQQQRSDNEQPAAQEPAVVETGPPAASSAVLEAAKILEEDERLLDDTMLQDLQPNSPEAEAVMQVSHSSEQLADSLTVRQVLANGGWLLETPPCCRVYSPEAEAVMQVSLPKQKAGVAQLQLPPHPGLSCCMCRKDRKESPSCMSSSLAGYIKPGMLLPAQ